MRGIQGNGLTIVSRADTTDQCDPDKPQVPGGPDVGSRVGQPGHLHGGGSVFVRNMTNTTGQGVVDGVE